MKDVFRIGVMAIALGLILAVIFILESIVSPVSPSFCNTSVDCEGLQHDDCEGEWACVNRYCSWECEEPPDTTCQSPSDCEALDLPHILCVGGWECEEGECVWACEVGMEAPELEYEVGECEEGVMREGYLEIWPTAAGIRLEQVLDYVCCAEIELEMGLDGNLITITEVNRGEMCKCMCSYEIGAEMSVLPGRYKVEVYGVEFPGQEAAKLGEGWVTVGKTEDRVLFIEQHTNTDGSTIAGNYPFMFIDFPAYYFDEDERFLEGFMGFDVDDVVAIYGSGESLSGDAGSGAATELSPVYSIPAEVTGDRITRLWEDGKVAIEHAGETITLEPGQTWEDVRVEETTGGYNTGLIELTITDSITNHGFIEKEDVEVW